MTRLRGRARGGGRVNDSAPHGHWGTTTVIGAVRLDGQTACMAVKGAMDREVFRQYVAHVLVPTLRQGDMVIWDNLATHGDVDSLHLIEAAGATVHYLPPYSPDMNPIEKMWSKTKEFLRNAKARSQEALYEAIGHALEKVTAKDAEGWFQSCGYSASQG